MAFEMKDVQEGFVASEDQLHEEARKNAGCDNFGDPSYLEGLRVLLRSLDESKSLSPLGRMILRRQILTSLTTRLRAEACLEDNPAAREVEIRRPIIITGLVRTGSTALHYLMGRDPGMQNLEFWLSAHPQPRPPKASWPEHSDFQESVAGLESLYTNAPDLMAVHEMKADWPEECGHILAQSFTDDRFECSAHLPSYCEWYHHTPHPETYTRHKQLIQLIGSTSPELRWLIKYPVHLRQLPALFDVYPDACIVQTHRDPRTVMASYTSFLAKVHRMHDENVDEEAIARTQLEGWAVAADAGVAYRREHGSDQFYDLQFEDFMADPIGSVKKIYAHFDQGLSAEGEKCLQAWEAEHPQGKHGKHRYERKDFVIPDHEILDRYADYLEFFGMMPR
ncbi:MAG: sulfotransferase [Deltaproteobacteria bacterium]|nr:sulfotransferase [Deltaproteobacteria bacterium]MBW2420865.1 sulfotransferase [Deltaproteobacteria bacterium]